MKRLLFLLAIWATPFMTFAQTSLFNGQDLTGWQIHGTEKWYVQDGELICKAVRMQNMAI